MPRNLPCKQNCCKAGHWERIGAGYSANQIALYDLEQHVKVTIRYVPSTSGAVLLPVGKVGTLGCLLPVCFHTQTLPLVIISTQKGSLGPDTCFEPYMSAPKEESHISFVQGTDDE